MSRQFWVISSLLISLFLFSSCQSAALRIELSRDYYNIGNAYSDLEEYDKAAEYYRRALDLDSSLNQAAFNLARTNLEIEDYNTALKLLNDLEAEDPENLLVLEMLGYSWYKVGDSERAGGYYRKSLALDSVHIRSLYNLCLLEKKKANWGMSRFYLERLLRLEDKQEYTVLLAELSLAEDDVDSAIGYYEDFLLEYEGYSEIYLAMKDLYLKTEQYDKVLTMIDFLIEDQPEEGLMKEYYFEKSQIEIQFLDDIILGQADLISALDAGYSDKESLDELIVYVDPLYKGDLEKLIKDHIKEPELSEDSTVDADAVDGTITDKDKVKTF